MPSVFICLSASFSLTSVDRHSFLLKRRNKWARLATLWYIYMQTQPRNRKQSWEVLNSIFLCSKIARSDIRLGVPSHKDWEAHFLKKKLPYMTTAASLHSSHHRHYPHPHMWAVLVGCNIYQSCESARWWERINVPSFPSSCFPDILHPGWRFTPLHPAKVHILCGSLATQSFTSHCASFSWIQFLIERLTVGT